MICEVNINYIFSNFVLAIQLFRDMVYHYRIKPVTSWHNITSRNAIESYSKIFIYQNIQWTIIRIPETILELLKCTRMRSRTLPVSTVLAAAIHVYGCQLDELRLPGYRQQCIIWFHSCVYVIMQYFVILDCTLLKKKLTTTTTTTMLCIAMIYINIKGMHCHKSYVWWIKQFVQQPFRCDSRFLENITPDAGLALVVPVPSCSITFLTEHIYVLDVKHCQFNESGSKLY